VGWGKLEPSKDFLLEVVAQDPDITLRDLQGALAEAAGVHANQTSLSRALDRLGFTHKESRWSLVADEQRRPDVARARSDWIRQRLPAAQKHPERLVFIDETSVKTNMTRTRGRAPKGQRLNAAAPFGKWSTQAFIAGLTADALIAPRGSFPVS
jgi:hypothetical protein